MHHGGVAVDGNDGEGVSHLVLVVYDDPVARNIVCIGGGTGGPCLGVCAVIRDVACSVTLEEHSYGIVRSVGDVLVNLDEVLLLRVVVAPSRDMGGLPGSHDVVLDAFRR